MGGERGQRCAADAAGGVSGARVAESQTGDRSAHCRSVSAGQTSGAISGPGLPHCAGATDHGRCHAVVAGPDGPLLHDAGPAQSAATGSASAAWRARVTGGSSSRLRGSAAFQGDGAVRTADGALAGAIPPSGSCSAHQRPVFGTGGGFLPGASGSRSRRFRTGAAGSG